MAFFPITYPKSQNTTGRLTEIFSFRRSSKISITRYDEVLNSIQAIASQFPISRQTLLGSQTQNHQISVLVADWTSAAEKDEFEPGDRYQSIKPAFGELIDADNHEATCHHIILPSAEKTTPEAGSFVFNFLTVAAEKQDQFAVILNKHVTSVFGDEKKQPVFFVAAPSREDVNVVAAIWGWGSESDAKSYLEGEAHKLLLSRTKDLITDVREYQAELSKWKPATEGGWKSTHS